MISGSTEQHLGADKDCQEAFKKAYQNRYCWDPSFNGYKGVCSWKSGSSFVEGEFSLSKELKVKVEGIEDTQIEKAISSQLWEVAIHRVSRPFEVTHAGNTFNFGDTNEIGREIIVGGKNKGDKYRIKDNIITMVYRNIHNTLINIYTKKIMQTDKGYLSRIYTSQYLDPSTGKALKPLNIFTDQFERLPNRGPWVLVKREIQNDSIDNQEINNQTFHFSELSDIN